MKVGIAGIGFMGMVHYLSYGQIEGCDVAALAEPDQKRLGGDWTDIKGNFGPPGQQMDLTGIATYASAAEMIAAADIDLVDVCLPPSMHADVTVRALEAGKHVFCEKPIALADADARRMVDAANAAGRILMIGHVLPFFPEYAKARQIIDSGKYGKLLGGHFKRVISDPNWLPHYWDADKIGGPMLDLHVHDAHFIRLLFGMPTAVLAQGRTRGELAEYWNASFEFTDPALVVSATSGTIGQQGRAFLHGFEIHLQRATMAFEFGVIDDQPELLLPFTVLLPDGKVERPPLGDGDPMQAFLAELTEVSRAVSAASASPLLAGELARDAVALCHCQTEAVRTRQRVVCS